MAKSKNRLELTWIGKCWRFHKDAVDAWVKHGLISDGSPGSSGVLRMTCSGTDTFAASIAT